MAINYQPDGHDGLPTQEATPSEPAQGFTAQHLQELQKADERSDRRLALLVFFATLAANFVGLIASLADASSLVMPVRDLVDPMPELQIAGSTTILGTELGLADDWQQVFTTLTAQHEYLALIGEVERTDRLTVEPVGTLAGVERAIEGKVHLLAASEPISGEEIEHLSAAGVTVSCAAPIGYDVIAFVTDVNNILSRPLTVQDLTDILAGEIRDWSKVGGAPLPIHVFAREGSGTTDLVLRTFLGSPDIPAHMIHCTSQIECLNQALETPGSLYWVSTAWLQTQPQSYLQPLTLISSSGVAANPLGRPFNPTRYPPALVRPLYMYVLSGPKFDPRSIELAKRFLAFVRGVQGQKILETHHFITHYIKPPGVVVQLPPGFEGQSGAPPLVCREQ